MFGLSPIEIVIVIAVVALLGGPSAIKQVARLFQTAQRAKSELTGKALLGRILDDDTTGAPVKRKRKRAKRRSAKRG